MYAVLTENLKRRILLELRGFWALDPKYKDTLTPNIQGKYSFDERPQQAIILKGSSATPMRFAADQYQGTVVSYCALYKVYGKNGTSIEWIREDSRAIQKNGGSFPTEPGVYWIEVSREEYDYEGVPRNYLVFYVDPLLSVIDQEPSRTDPRTYTLAAGKYHPGSLVLYEMPGNLVLYEDVNYTADSSTGVITLTAPMPSGTSLSADYCYAGTSTGPFPVEENGANNTVIPGVVLAFGRRASEGDIMAVVVTGRREPSAREYGGKFEMSLDLDIMARDVYAQGEISDRTLMFLETELRDRLSFEGIEIEQVSHGGESEEPYDDNADDYFYNASISMSVVTDWSIHVPLGPTINRVLPRSVESDKAVAGLSDDQLVEMGDPTNLRLTDDLGLERISDPWFLDRTKDYEMIR